jgi:hypothetical protein
MLTNPGPIDVESVIVPQPPLGLERDAVVNRLTNRL